MNTSSDVIDGQQEVFGDISFMSSSDGDGSNENLQEKSLNQLMEEREKLLSMLNSPKNESLDDGNDEKTNENDTDDDDSLIFSQPRPPQPLQKSSSSAGSTTTKEYDPTPMPRKKFKVDDDSNYALFKTPAYFERSPDYDDFLARPMHFDVVNGHEFESNSLDFTSHLDDFHRNNSHLDDFHPSHSNSIDYATASTNYHSNSLHDIGDFPTNAVDFLNNSADFAAKSMNFDEEHEDNFRLVIDDYGKCPQVKTTATTAVDIVDEDDDVDDNTSVMSDYDEDMDEEIYKLLDEELENGVVLTTPGNDRTSALLEIDKQLLLKEKFKDLAEPPNIKDKIVMKHRGTEYFEVLPDGWIEVTHSSGIPVYLHKTTRVCTLSRPYFLGPGSVRNHDVPFAAVPCLHQRKIREREVIRAQKCLQDTQFKNTDDDPDSKSTQSQSTTSALDKLKMPQVKLQTADDFKTRNLSAEQLHEYCKNVFEFEKIQVMRFKSWSDHRAYHRKNKRDQQQQLHQNNADAASAKQKKVVQKVNNHNEPQQKNNSTKTLSSLATSSAADPTVIGRPMLPSNVKLITVPDMEKGSKPQQKQFFLNPQGKTSIAVLHEYVQKVLKGQVCYEFNETRNAANPYMATVKILSLDRQRNGSAVLAKDEELWVSAGNGVGNSKKNAKLDAARDALRVLVPGIEFSDDGVAGLNSQQDDVTDLFDLIPIIDSRVHELSVKAGQPTPFVILQECLKRHSAFGNTSIEMKIERVKHQQHEFFMKVGKHEVKVMCTNKKEGKQKAAQFMLEKLQPQIKTWGSLIRLYGYGAQRKLQETRKEKDSIIKLQSQSKNQPNEPNTAILDKLRQEMKKLFESPDIDDASSATASTSSTTGKKKKHSETNRCSVKSIDI